MIMKETPISFLFTQCPNCGMAQSHITFIKNYDCHCYGCGNDYIFHDGLNVFHKWIHKKYKSLEPLIYPKYCELDKLFEEWKSENKGLF